MKLVAVILAAGKGTRIGATDKPKVMYKVNNRPIVDYMVEDIENSGIEEITLVVGFMQEVVRDYFKNRVKYVEQKEQLGTGHAVLMAKEELKGKSDAVLVCFGDHATYEEETIKKLIETFKKEKPALAMLTVEFMDPVKWAYGRIIRNQEGEIEGIVEQKDCNNQQLKITECSPSFFIFESEFLWNNLEKLNTKNAQGEYYLSDMIEIAKDQGKKIISSPVSKESEVLGINTKEQLKEVEKILQSRN